MLYSLFLQHETVASDAIRFIHKTGVYEVTSLENGVLKPEKLGKFLVNSILFASTNSKST